MIKGAEQVKETREGASAWKFVSGRLNTFLRLVLIGLRIALVQVIVVNLGRTSLTARNFMISEEIQHMDEAP